MDEFQLRRNTDVDALPDTSRRSKREVSSVLRTLAFVLPMMSALLSAGCSLIGIRTAEEPEYRLILSEGNKELRQYPALVVARTFMSGSYEQTGNDSFRILAGYIFGKNRPKDSGEGDGSTKIPMTAPVLQEKTQDGWRMSFVMPSAENLSSLPEPMDDRVDVEELPEFRVAAIRYTGLTSERKITEKAAELEAWLLEKGIKAAGKPLSARYDPPWTIPFFRRNEVLLITQDD